MLGDYRDEMGLPGSWAFEVQGAPGQCLLIGPAEAGSPGARRLASLGVHRAADERR
jgi:hypothetical protein